MLGERIAVQAGGVLIAPGDLVVRVYEPDGRRTAGTVRIAAPVTQVHEASLIEDVADEVAAPDGVITLELTPFEVRTYRVRLAG